MADVTNDLIYEVLKSMQTRLDRIDGNVAGVRGELQAMRLHLNGLNQDVSNLYQIVDRQDARL
ncbi:MAG: hypothetical protein A2093_10185, partial [Caulobacterales bacterium GWE1_67_11]